MSYNNGKIPAVGDKVIAFIAEENKMVAGVVAELVTGLNKLTVIPVSIAASYPPGPNEVTTWPSTTPPAVLIDQAKCLLESDIHFAPINQGPPR